MKLKKNCLTEFSTYWLTDWLANYLRNFTMAKATGLIFSLFNVASAWEVPCISHGLTVPYFVSNSSLLSTKGVLNTIIKMNKITND